MIVNPQLSLLDLTVEAGILSDVMGHLYIGGKNILSVPRHDALLVDMVIESIEEDSNITCVSLVNMAFGSSSS